jgi:hypothetical protein
MSLFVFFSRSARYADGVMKRRLHWTGYAAAAGLALLCASCEIDFDDDIDHDIPEGQGSLVIDNWTLHEINVYADGVYLGKADELDDDAFDLDPGTVRIVLDEDGGDRFYADEADIIEGRLTIWEVLESGFDDYAVRVRIQ